MDESIFRKLAGGVGGGLAKRKSTSPLQVFFLKKESKENKMRTTILTRRMRGGRVVWHGMGWHKVKL